MTLINATTIDRVKALAKITDTDDDAELTAIVAGVSQRFEGFLGQQLMEEERTVEYHVQPRANVVPLNAAPVVSISSVKNSTDWDWASTTALDTDQYHVDATNGLLYFNFDLTPGAKALQVTFTAGFGTDTADLISNYPAIALAADLQAVSVWRRRQSPHGTSRKMGGNSVEFEAAVKLLPEVVEALSPFRVISFGLS